MRLGEGPWQVCGGHSPSSNSRAGLWAHPQPPGLAAPARRRVPRVCGRRALGGTLEPCCPLAAFSGDSAAATGEALRAACSPSRPTHPASGLSLPGTPLPSSGPRLPCWPGPRTAYSRAFTRASLASTRIWISALEASSAAPDSSDCAFSKFTLAACGKWGTGESQAATPAWCRPLHQTQVPFPEAISSTAPASLVHPCPRDTHPHVEHVQRHGLFGQQLHGGIRIHCDRAAAHYRTRKT